MIFRERFSRKTSETYSFRVELNVVDVKRTLVNSYIYAYLYKGIGENNTFPKQTYLSWLKNISQDIKSDGKYAREIALWAFDLAENRGFLTKSDDKGIYYTLSKDIISASKKCMLKEEPYTPQFVNSSMEIKR